MKNNNLFVVLLIAAVVTFLSGYFFGYRNSTPTIVNKTDTIEILQPITPIFEETQPKNTIIDTNNKKIELNVKPVKPTFESRDSFSYEGLKFKVFELGNDSGIIKRNIGISGTIPTKIINNTISISKKVPLFQLNAGITSSFDKQFNILDIGPCIQLDYKRKVNFGYGYELYKNRHNFTVTLKIK